MQKLTKKHAALALLACVMIPTAQAADGEICRTGGQPVLIYAKPSAQSPTLAIVHQNAYVSFGDETTNVKGEKWVYISAFKNQQGKIVNLSSGGWILERYLCGG